MKTETKITSNIEDLIDNDWLWFDPNPDDNASIIRITPENIKEAAIFYNVPDKFLEMLDDAFRSMANDIIHELKADLEDVWERVDE